MQVDPQTREALVRLDLHQQRREGGIPTISVIVGGPVVTRDLWCRWARVTDRTTATGSPASFRSLVDAWLEKLLSPLDLCQSALEYLAAFTGETREQLKAQILGLSPYQLDLYWQQLPFQDASIEARLLRWLVEQVAQRKEVSSRDVAVLSDLLEAKPYQNAADIIAALAALLPRDPLPGLLIMAPASRRHDETKVLDHSLVSALARLAERLPTLPLAIAVEPDMLQGYLSAAPESHIKAVFREGIVSVPSLTAEDIRAWLSRQGVPDPARFQGLSEALTRYGATATVLSDALSLTQLTAQGYTPQTEPMFRSQAERFLFILLDSIPETHGMFALNGKLEVLFGKRRLEVDLLAEAERIAIEIDGYYHFQDPENYRRDRRKDFALQRQGFLVLRFLAEDVVSRLEEILNTVRQAVDLQRQRHSEIN